MIKVLYISPASKSAVGFYRGIGPLSKLKDVVITDASNGDVSWTHLQQHDLVFLERPCRQQDVYVAQLAKLNGVPIVVDMDDNIAAVPEDHESYPAYKDLHHNSMECIALADAVLVTTDHLQREYEAVNKNIHVIPNAHNNQFTNWRSHNEKSNVILYRGGRSHYSDVEEYAEVLIDLINETEGFQFVFMGLNPWFLRKYIANKSKITHIPDVDIMYYFIKICEINPRAVIVPLENNEFNKSKSNIAYLEATYSGAVTVGPSFVSDFRRPGVLQYDDERSFYNQIKDVISGKRDTARLHREAREYILSKQMLDGINKKRLQVLQSVMK